MKDICVIGNSQIISLMQGIKGLKEEKFHVNFWGIPGGRGPHLQLKGDRIHPIPSRREKLQTDIEYDIDEGLDLSAFDAVVVSGVGFGAMRKQFDNFISNYYVAGLIDGDIRSIDQVISKKLYLKMISDFFNKLPSVNNLQLIRSIFAGPIFVQMFPMPTSLVLQAEDFPFPEYGRNTRLFFQWFQGVITSLGKAAAKKNEATVVQYPDDFFPDGLAREEFRTRDAWHLNGTFGSQFWEHFYENYFNNQRSKFPEP